MNDFWNELSEIKRKLDQIEIELSMNAEAIESIEMNLRFLKEELDYELRGNSSAG